MPWVAVSGGPSPHSVSIFTQLPRISPGSQDKWRCERGEKERKGRKGATEGDLEAVGMLSGLCLLCPLPCTASLHVCWVLVWAAVCACECITVASCLSMS